MSSSCRTPSPTASIMTQPIKKGTMRDLWGDTTKWISHYRCEACFNLMSRKNPTTKPQIIYSCKHVVCAGCIVDSYFIYLNKMCPVANCNKCVNPRDEDYTTLNESTVNYYSNMY